GEADLGNALLAPLEIPARDRELVNLDRDENIVTLGRPRMADRDKVFQQVYYYEIPLASNPSYLLSSKNLDPKTRSIVVINRNGVEYLRFYYIGQVADAARLAATKKGVQLHRSSLWAAKLQGHSSWYVWNPNGAP